MLNSWGLFDKEFRVSTCQLAHLKPFTYPQTQKVPRLLARNPQISNIKIYDVQTAILGISASVESATLWLSVKIGYDTAHLGKHIVIAL